jgi:hypothetical protein
LAPEKAFAPSAVSDIFTSRKAAAKKVRFGQEEGFIDLDIPLTDLSEDEDGSFRLTVRGILESRPVGFCILIQPGWKAVPLEEHEVTNYWGSVKLQSVGPASNNFVEILSSLYDVDLEAGTMLESVEAEAVGINSDPSRVAEMPVRMKLFFHADDESRYAEVFLNIDAVDHVVQFHEKDEGYRANLLRALHESP